MGNESIEPELKRVWQSPVLMKMSEVGRLTEGPAGPVGTSYSNKIYDTAETTNPGTPYTFYYGPTS